MNPFLEEKAFTPLIKDESELGAEEATPDLYVAGQLPRWVDIFSVKMSYDRGASLLDRYGPSRHVTERV